MCRLKIKGYKTVSMRWSFLCLCCIINFDPITIKPGMCLNLMFAQLQQ